MQQKQTKKASFIEAWLNVFIGFVVAVVANYAILPLFGFVPKLWESVSIALLFTLVSVARSYCVRRLFEHLRIARILP